MASQEYPAQLVGWVVWGKVKSLPWWPGQVMHPSKGPPEVQRMAGMKSNSGKLLVMFLGDNKYAFLTRESVVDFAENKEKHSSTNYSSKFWKLGLEEAEELLARRAGLQPATDHEPVDFAAARNINFARLASAWKAESSPVKPQISAGATVTPAPGKAKPTPPQPEAPKPAMPSPAKDGKPPATALLKESAKSHRAAASSDDGRPKSIGGAMLEWARFMPLVATTRKGAECTPGDEALRCARRLARGEAEEGPSDEQALHVLHAFTLQRRMRAIEAMARTQQAPAGHSGAGKWHSGCGSKHPGPPGGALLVVQETRVLSNAAAVPVPLAVVKALQHAGQAAGLRGEVERVPVLCEPAAGSGASPGPSGDGGSGAGAAQEQHRTDSGHELEAMEVDVVLKVNGKLLPLIAPSIMLWSPPTDTAVGPPQQPQQRQQAQASSAPSDPCAPAAGGETSTVAEAVPPQQQLAAPHFTHAPEQDPTADARLQPAEGLAQPTVATSAQQASGQDAEGAAPAAKLLITAAPSSAEEPAGAQEQCGQDPATAPAEDSRAHVLTTADQQEGAAQERWVKPVSSDDATSAEVQCGDTAPEPQHQPAQEPAAEDVPDTAADAFAAAATGAESKPAGYLKPSRAVAATSDPEAAWLHGTREEDLSVQPRDELPAPMTTTVAGTAVVAQGFGEPPASRVVAAEAGAQANPPTDLPPASATASGATAQPVAAFAPATVIAPAALQVSNGRTPAPTAAPTSAAAAPAPVPLPGPSACMDLSRGLAPWLRGEVRVTCWAVCGPRLLLVTVSADRKRDGGLGGIKREARLLLAEARERRGISPAGNPGEDMEGGGKAEAEPRLKRRLRSSAPPAPQGGSAGGVAAASAASSPPGQGSRTSPPRADPQPPLQQRASDGCSEGLVPLPPISSGPAAAALMRSRLLQQKRMADAAAGGSCGAGSQAHRGDASRTGSSTGGGGGGASEPRVPKKVKLVRFPGGSTAAAAPSRTSSGGGAPPAAAATAAPAGLPPSAVTPAADATCGRRCISQGQLGDDCSDDGQQFARVSGGGTPPPSYHFSTPYDAEWDMSYPPWLPQPAQKGPFITVSQHLNRSHHHRRHSHHHHHHHHLHAGGQQLQPRTSVAGAAPPTQLQHNHIDHYEYYTAAQPDGMHEMQAAHQSAGYISAPDFGHRSSGYGGWQSEDPEPMYCDRAYATDWNVGPSVAEYSYPLPGIPSAGGWLPDAAAEPGYGLLAVPSASDGAVSPEAGCGQILLDICVGDEDDQEGPAVPGMGGDGLDTALAATMQLPGGAGGAHSNAVDAAFGTPVQPIFNPHPEQPYGLSHHLQLPASPFALHQHQQMPPAAADATPFSFNGADVTEAPEAGAADAGDDGGMYDGADGMYDGAGGMHDGNGGMYDGADGMQGGAKGGYERAGSMYNRMTPADVDLAATAALLADRHMSVCESATINASAATAPPADIGGATPCTQPTQPQPAGGGAPATAGTADAAAMAIDSVAGAGGDDGAGQAPQQGCVSWYEGEVARLRRECELLREQLKLRLTPGCLDPLPQQQLPYHSLVAQVSERVLSLALALPSLSGPAKQSFIQYSRVLLQEANAAGQASASAPLEPQAPAAAAADAGDGGAAAACGGRSLAVARVAADLVRSAASPGLPLHPEDRWAFINLAAELMRP